MRTVDVRKGDIMIDLYCWGTTNGRRALIMAEEAGLPFTLHQIDIRKGDQKTPEYERINPYRKIPALVDPDGPGGKPSTVFESVAICFYLAEKAGRFLGSPADRPNVLKWSMFHATNVLAALAQVRDSNDSPAATGLRKPIRSPTSSPIPVLPGSATSA
jgi:GST-like protein